jgi:hypothetical protein
VLKHFETRSVTDLYLITTDFTDAELQDIVESPYKINVTNYTITPRPYVNRYVKKAKMVEIATSYEKHRARLLQKA